MPEEVESTPVAPTQQKSDEDFWAEIVKLKLDGVMYHIVLMEQSILHEMHGFGDLHKQHAKEEFESYLHVLKDYTTLYGKVVDVSNVRAPIITIAGNTLEENFESGLSLYETWEKSVLKKLKMYKEKIKDHNSEIDYSINDVKEELYCIRRMEDDISDNKACELNNWLQKKFGEC